MQEQIKRFIRKTKKLLYGRIFIKTLISVSTVLIACSVILGLVLLTFSSDRIKNENQTLLENSAKNVALLSGQTAIMIIQDDGGSKRVDFKISERTLDVITVLGKSLEADIFIVGLDGKTTYCSEPVNANDRNCCTHFEHRFSNSFIDKILAQKSNFRSVGTMDGIYEEDHYLVGVPINAYDDENKLVKIGVVFAASSTNSADTVANEMQRVFAVTIIVAIAVCVMMAYAIAYRLTRPMSQIASATRAFANGNFSLRVPVHSEDELGQLAKSFNNMADSLSSSETMHRSFLANVSHELKTPMTSISGFVHGMLEGVIPPEKHREYMQKVADETDRLARMVKAMM
ncbi:MAG: HAMP domain-containing protein, partial [Oscillospiraceae bacterium]|nr:HAMP domain-containing protein [Oscillospiraceae bacterium]